MILTDEEKGMRDGAEGAATAAAMDLLIRYGNALACDRLCDVRNVAGTMTQPSPVKERLVREGGWDKAFAVINLDCDADIEVPAMRVPTCQLQHGFGPDARGIVPYPEQRIELQQDAESFPGITPEAPTLEAAFGGARAPEPVPYGPAERRAVYETLNSQGDRTDVDFVLLGCPHASVDQVRRAAAALEGRRLSPGTELWLMLPRALRDVADHSGYTEVIERAGGRLLGDSCPAMSRVAPEGTRVFATDSAKQAHYLPAILGIEAWFGSLEDCVDAAVTGRWRGRLP